MPPSPLPQGPRGNVLFGVYRDIVKDPFAFLKENFETYPGISRFRIVHASIVHVWHPPFIKHILQTKFDDYGLAVDRKAMKLLFRKGLLTNDGASWRQQRKLVQPAFHKDRLAFLLPKIVAAVGERMSRWQGFQTRREAFDVYAEMKDLTNDIIARTLLGSETFPEAAELGELLLHLKEETLFRFYRPSFPTWVPTPKNRDYLRRKKKVDRIIARILEARRKTQPAEPDILTHLMNGGKMDDSRLTDEIISIYAAAHEPTATILMYIFYLLTVHPDTAGRCREEIRATGDGAPNAEGLRAQAFTLTVIKEALRLYPSVWAFTRQALKADRVGDYLIRKGDHVVFSPYFIHRNPEIWPEPETFRPARFAPDQAPAAHEFAYLPFGGGPKYCVGSEFAMLILQAVTAMIAVRHELKMKPGFRFEIEAVTTLRPKNGFWVTL